MTKEQTEKMFKNNKNKLPVITFESKEELQKWLDKSNEGIEEFLEECHEASKLFKDKTNGNVHGKWEYHSVPFYPGVFKCSECDYEINRDDYDSSNFNFCPKCGAKMDRDWITLLYDGSKRRLSTIYGVWIKFMILYIVSSER